SCRYQSRCRWRTGAASPEAASFSAPYSRVVSSRRYLISTPTASRRRGSAGRLPGSSAQTRDLSMSWVRRSRRSVLGAGTLPSLAALGRVPAKDPPHRPQGDPTGEAGEPPQQRTLGLGEQLVAPVQRRPQRLLSRRRRPASPREQADAIIQTGGDLLDREDLQ